VNEQLLPGASVVGQLLLWVKLPLIETCWMDSATVLLFVKVTDAVFEL
jgi:hypothetical protein